MAHLSLSLLGPLYVTLGDIPVTDFGYDHVRALLAYLAVEADRPHRREALAGLLWPNQTDQVALENLRHALYRLQQAVGNQQASPPFLLISRSTLQFNVNSDYSLDVSLFEDLIAADDGVEGQMHRLERAVAMYRGAFLQGFSLGSSYALEEWLLQKREQLDRQMSAALYQLVQTCEARGEYERAEGYARRALILDPWDEHTHRQLMLVLALEGRRGAALAQYGALLKLLRDEFGVEPEPETVALCARIRGNQLDSSAGRPKMTLAPSVSTETMRSPFVGREADLLRLSRCLDRALDGHGRGALISGETGSGKTALMAEFARRAMVTHPQLVVACGSCSAQGGISDPYLPFREILQSLSGDVSVPLPNGTIPRAYADRQWAAAPVTIQALVAVGQDLIHRLVAAKPLGLRAESLTHQMSHGGDLAPWRVQLQAIIERPHRSGGSDALIPQSDLISQYARVLQAVAQAQPVLLILDDLQWADSGTVSLLFHLSRRLEGHRILVMAAYRSDDVTLGRDEQRSPLETIVSEFRRVWDDCEVNLDQAEGHDLVNALLDCEPNRLGPQFRETLYRHTAGHALFTVELLRSLREHGGLRRNGERFWVEDPDLDWETLPPRVELMIAERIAHLPEALRAILSVASVEGDVFTAEVIARAQGMGEQQVCSCLSRELGGRPRLVRAEGLAWLGNQSLSRYRFQHHLFQQYFYNRMDAVERARLHGTVLRALEELYGAETGALAGVLARHAEAAGMAERAAQFWLQAGQRAYALSAHDEAAALFRRSLDALSALPDSPERARIELETQIALATTLFVSQGWGAPERIEAADRSYCLSLQLGETKHRLPLLVMLANTTLGRLECRRALAFAEQLLALAQESGQALYIAAGHLMMGMCLVSLSEPRSACAHLEHGLAMLRGQTALSLAESPSMGIDMRVSLRLWLSCALWLSGYLDQSREHLRQALQFSEELGHPPTLAVALAMSCAVLGGMHGEIEAARKHSDRLLRLADTNKLPFVRPWGLFYQNWAQALSSQGIEAALQMRGSLEALRESGTLATNLQMHCLLSEVYLRLGQVEKGLAIVSSALSESEQTGASCYRAEMLRLKGELLLRANPEAGDSAAACFMQALKVAHRQAARILELRAATSLARLLQRQGQPAEALRTLADVYGWFTEGRDTPDLQEARCLVEELARQGAARDDDSPQ